MLFTKKCNEKNFIDRCCCLKSLVVFYFDTYLTRAIELQLILKDFYHLVKIALLTSLNGILQAVSVSKAAIAHPQ